MTTKFRLDIIKCASFNDVKKSLFSTFDAYKDLFPSSKEAKVLLKPNFNANMNALTGNTTDLRILSTVIRYLKENSFTNILIGEGTNSGYYRNKIGVISRLKVDQLARYYGVKVKDLNYAVPYEIDFNGSIKAQVAKDCIEADFFINMPKLKTHFEEGMSVCLKNLMGCLIGQENKKKAHQDLAENILRINQKIKPHLHIVDGLIAMEGLGPTRGTPIRMDIILIGTDPYLVDLAAARLASFDYKKIGTLNLAEKKGLLSDEHHKYIDSLDLKNLQKTFAPPNAGPLVRFIHSPKRQKYFLKIRNMKLFSYLADTQWFGKLLFLSGLRQDVFLGEEMSCEAIQIEEKFCNDCGICQDLCPLGQKLPSDFEHLDEENCIRCLYCFLSCPEGALQFKGEMGFLREQLRQYDEKIRELYLV